MNDLDKMDEIIEKLTAIESLLKRLPEIQAAVYLQLKEEYDAAKLKGKKTGDIWTIAPPTLR